MWYAEAMSLDEATRERIAGLLKEHRVTLFMKGTRSFPQCGFSATVVQILDQIVPGEYQTVNVLSDPAIREGVKQFSNWPTIPQLYVEGELIGGCDIVKDMFASGELHGALGVQMGEVAPPSITITDSAAAALRGALADAAPGESVHIVVDGRWQHGMDLGPKGATDLEVEANGIKVFVKPMMASRLDGLVIDHVDGAGGAGFKLDNPNAPATVKQMTVQELAAKLDSGAPFELFDVRSPQEREICVIANARILDEGAQKHIMGLPKDTPLVFHCHRGQRSQQAAQFFLKQGFTDVTNVAGGIDAWSVDIDPTVKRY
jgi:monothiol glutaredoxin